MHLHYLHHIERGIMIEVQGGVKKTPIQKKTEPALMNFL